DPIRYTDPTGHWEESDKTLNKEAQAKIIALTSAYYNASTDDEKKAISAQATAIRKDLKSKDTKVVFPLNFESTAITLVNQQAENKRGYMNGEEWNRALSMAGIQSTKVSSEQGMSGAKSETITTIGRTNLDVTSSTNYKQASSNIGISYN